MADPEKYFSQSKEDWSEDFYPNIELNEWDGEEFVDWIETWSPELAGEDEED